MKNIAILTSDTAVRGMEVARIFNQGNQYRVTVLLADSLSCPALSTYASLGIPVMSFPAAQFVNDPEPILALLRRENIDIILLDNFLTKLNPLFYEAYPDIMILDNQHGAREVAERFQDSDFHVEQQWADALGMQFDPEVAKTPPPLPRQEIDPEIRRRQPSPEVPRPEPIRQSFIPHPDAPKPPVNTGRPTNLNDGKPMPPTYLVWSILATVCCCLPLGIVAIIMSSNVTARYYAGDYEGSQRASEQVQWWIIASIVLGVVTSAIQLPLMLL